jgi:hypothetical protein
VIAVHRKGEPTQTGSPFQFLAINKFACFIKKKSLASLFFPSYFERRLNVLPICGNALPFRHRFDTYALGESLIPAQAPNLFITGLVDCCFNAQRNLLANPKDHALY